MEAEIKAGAKLDMLTKSELQEVMDGMDFNVKIGRGLKFRRISGSLPIDPTTHQVPETPFGPEPGFTWAVQNISAWWSDLANPSANVYAVHYLNNINPIQCVWDSSINNGLPDFGSVYRSHTKTSLILHSGDVLISQTWEGLGAVTTPSPFLSVAYNVIEVPTFSEGLLNL